VPKLRYTVTALYCNTQQGAKALLHSLHDNSSNTPKSFTLNLQAYPAEAHLQVHTQLPGKFTVERMLSINQQCLPSCLLYLSNCVQRKRALAAALWTIHLDNAPLRPATTWQQQQQLRDGGTSK
jgi:hypothetical protein